MNKKLLRIIVKIICFIKKDFKIMLLAFFNFFVFNLINKEKNFINKDMGTYLARKREFKTIVGRKSIQIFYQNYDIQLFNLTSIFYLYKNNIHFFIF